MNGKYLVVSFLMLFIMGSPQAGNKEKNFLDLSALTRPIPRDPSFEWSTGGLPDPRAAVVIPFSMTLHPLERQSFLYAEHFTYEFSLKNISGQEMAIPWSMDWKRVFGKSTVGDPAPPGYTTAAFYLFAQDGKGDAFDTPIEVLRGSDNLPGSIKVLQPGEEVRIRVPTSWELTTEWPHKSKMPKLPYTFQVRAVFSYGYRQSPLSVKGLWIADRVGSNNLSVELKPAR